MEHDFALLSEDTQTEVLLESLRTRLRALTDKSATAVSEAIYQTVRSCAEACGQKPDLETFYKKPGTPRHFPDDTCHVVAWEAGPYEWAIPASFVVMNETGRLCEPYYSFDLCLYDNE
jgi:hypothetical protein